MSIIMAIVSGAIMLAAVIISYAMEGSGDALLGAMGLCAIALAAYGFILGLRGLNQKRVNHKLAFIGTVASGLAVILWLAIWFFGASLS